MEEVNVPLEKDSLHRVSKILALKFRDLVVPGLAEIIKAEREGVAR